MQKLFTFARQRGRGQVLGYLASGGSSEPLKNLSGSAWKGDRRVCRAALGLCSLWPRTNRLDIRALEFSQVRLSHSLSPDLGRLSGQSDDVIRLCAENRLQEAVDVLENMDHQGIWSLGTETYSTLLLACMKKQALVQGKRVHAHINRAGLQSSFYLGILLVRMYAACGKMGLARTAFRKARNFAGEVKKQNVFIWHVLIRGYLKLKHNTEALRAFGEMINEGVKPDKFVLVAALNACTSITDLEDGRQIHNLVIDNGFESDLFVNNALIEMYGKCGSTRSARQIFESMRQRNVVSWNGLIAGYAQHGHGIHAFKMFEQMRLEGFKPDRSTFSSVLKACGDASALKEGRQVHMLIMNSEFAGDSYLGTALVAMYAKCGNIQAAFAVFEDLPRRPEALWSEMIKACAKGGYDVEAIKLFEQMQVADVKPTTETCVQVLHACASTGSLQHGHDIHSKIVKSGCELDILIENAIISMYITCRSMESAKQVFYKMRYRDIVSWNSMLEGYVKHQDGKEALKLYKQLLLDDARPNAITYMWALDACASLHAAEEGRRVYAHACKRGLASDLSVQVAVVDMFVRCDSPQNAINVLHSLPKPPTVTWISFVTSNSKHGITEETSRFLEKLGTEQGT